MSDEIPVLTLPEWATQTDGGLISVQTAEEALMVTMYIPEAFDEVFRVVIMDPAESRKMVEMVRIFRKSL